MEEHEQVGVKLFQWYELSLLLRKEHKGTRVNQDPFPKLALKPLRIDVYQTLNWGDWNLIASLMEIEIDQGVFIDTLQRRSNVSYYFSILWNFCTFWNFLLQFCTFWNFCSGCGVQKRSHDIKKKNDEIYPRYTR